MRGVSESMEAKATRTPRPAMAQSLRRLAGAITHYQKRSLLVHEGGASAAGTALAPGVAAVTLPQLLAGMSPSRKSAGN